MVIANKYIQAALELTCLAQTALGQLMHIIKNTKKPISRTVSFIKSYNFPSLQEPPYYQSDLQPCSTMQKSVLELCTQKSD